MKPWPLLLLAGLPGAALAADATNPGEAFARGKFTLNLRLRYEDVRQTGLQDADAFTLQTRLGFTTAPWRGWKARLEAADITAADGDSYSQSGLNPGGAGHAVIADPESREISQAWVAFSSGEMTATLGRQRLVLDNARFVGDSGWRQNPQTFDALVVQENMPQKITLTYAYVQQVNRVFGPEHPQGKWQSASHLFNASYTGVSNVTLTSYAYLLDLSNSAVNSCATYGGFVTGAIPLPGGFKITWRGEAAAQSDYGRNPLSYATRYHLGELGVALPVAAITAGDEVLGSDHNVGFKTPLATLHAFNGWADLFLTTPAAGLHDAYVKMVVNGPATLSGVVFYHRFKTELTDADLGEEVDAQLSRKIGPRTTALIKYASYRHGASALPDVQKFWAQLEFAY